MKKTFSLADTAKTVAALNQEREHLLTEAEAINQSYKRTVEWFDRETKALSEKFNTSLTEISAQHKKVLSKQQAVDEALAKLLHIDERA